MSCEEPDSTYNYSGVSGEDKLRVSDEGDVPQVTKRDVILRFMAKHRIPLRPKEIYGGLLCEQEITFSYRTVQNKVSDLREEGLIKRVSIDDKAGEVVDIPESESGRRAYYIITEKGFSEADS